MRSIVINGKLHAAGRNVTLSGHRIVVDGQDVTPDSKDIRIEINGNVESLTVDVCNEVVINGSVSDVSVQSGDVACGNVSGSVQTLSGDVHCGSVGGNVRTVSGDIEHL